MATSQSSALKHWATIIKRWPIDKVRPENVWFQTVMQRRLDKIIAPAPATSPIDANPSPPAAPEPFNEKKEMQQVNALYSLLENRYSNAYPIPQSLRHPASSPTHYDDVVQEMEEAPSRSWLGALRKRIKGSLRFK